MAEQGLAEMVIRILDNRGPYHVEYVQRIASLHTSAAGQEVQLVRKPMHSNLRCFRLCAEDPLGT